MAKEYLEKLSKLLNEVQLEGKVAIPLVVKHFFSGAALYANEQICASWSPAGLAFRLSDKETERLISSGKAKPLKYFAKGHIKKGYALFENPEEHKANYWKKYLIKAIQQTQ